jgi:hypothetical protein
MCLDQFGTLEGGSMARAFVIRPFGKKKDAAGKELDFERVHNELIGPTLEATHLSGSTTGEIIETGNIREDMFSLIVEADLVICDITVHNANVFYELGIRHALRKRRTVLIKGEPAADSTPFDVLTDRYLSYDTDNPAAARGKLIEMIEATLRSNWETDSPIFRMLPTLVEADPSSEQVVPLDFREEVDRARGEVEGLAAAPSTGSPRPAVSVDRTRADRRRPVGAQGL